TSDTRGDCASFQASACSRPPPPMTRIFMDVVPGAGPAFYRAGRLPPLASMPEVADAGEDHGDAVLVGGGDDFAVAHRTARLDHRLDAGRGSRVDAVAE